MHVFDGVAHTPLPNLGAFLAFGPSFHGGVTVASARLGGDTNADVIVGATSGLPEVKVFRGSDGSLKGDFLAYSAAFHGGVRVAVGDINGDGTPDIVTGPGRGGAGEVHGFDGGTLFGIEFFFVPASAAPSGGVWLASGG